MCDLDAIYMEGPKAIPVEKMERFNDYWGISHICNLDRVFIRNGKRYQFYSQFFEPSITLKCLDDESMFSFGVSSSIKEDFYFM